MTANNNFAKKNRFPGVAYLTKTRRFIVEIVGNLDSPIFQGKMVDKLEWLNNEFVQRVLQYNEYDTSINVTNISVKPATSKGDNYASDMYRVTVKYTQKEGKTRVNKETSIVCKFEPLEEDARKEAVNIFTGEFRKRFTYRRVESRLSN